MRTLSLDQSVAMIPDGASLMIGGFMAVGRPERIIDEIVRQHKRDLTVIANDTAMPGKGIGKLVEAFLADYLGNLSYTLTARNFNSVIAMAAETVIASADNIVPIGVLSPDHVVTPAPLVDYLIANS
jgi:acetate CoA/acetoacetate CoA-transferase alpha subunit